MKRLLLFLLLAMPVLLFAQYPPSGNKQRLGWQTTGDGLVYRDAGPPSYTPNSRNNAYIYLDTIARRYYHFSSGAWRYLSAEKYIRLQDVTVGAAAVADSLITYDRLFFAADLTSGASSDKAVQLPIAGLDSTYAGRVVRLSVIDSSATYDYAITSSSPDALLVGDTLATSYSVENGETAEFQLYVFDTIYQWRLIHTSRADSLILPDSLAYGTGTTNYLSRWIAPFTLGTAGISDDGSEIQFARPTVLYGVNTAAPATYGTFGIDNTLGIERPTYYNGSAWVPWLAYSGGTNQYSYFSNSNTITSGTQLTRDANGVNIGDGNYFRLPSNSTVGSKLLVEAQTEYDNTFDQPFYRDGVGRRPIGEWYRSGSNIYLSIPAVIGGISPVVTGTFTPKLTLDGSTSGASGRTGLVIRNTNAGSAAILSLINSTGKTFGVQISSPSYAIGEQAIFFTEQGIDLGFLTDGHLTSGGTSDIYFSTGGYLNSNRFVVFSSDKRVGIGTLTPTEKFEISSGNILTTNTTNGLGSITLKNLNNGTSARGVISINVGNATASNSAFRESFLQVFPPAYNSASLFSSYVAGNAMYGFFPGTASTGEVKSIFVIGSNVVSGIRSRSEFEWHGVESNNFTLSSSTKIAGLRYNYMRLPVIATSAEDTIQGAWWTNSTTLKPRWSDGTTNFNLATETWVTSNNYTGFTPAAGAGTGSNVTSGDTLSVLGGYGINTSVAGKDVTIEVDTTELVTDNIYTASGTVTADRELALPNGILAFDTKLQVQNSAEIYRIIEPESPATGNTFNIQDVKGDWVAMGASGGDYIIAGGGGAYIGKIESDSIRVVQALTDTDGFAVAASSAYGAVMRFNDWGQLIVSGRRVDGLKGKVFIYEKGVGVDTFFLKQHIDSDSLFADSDKRFGSSFGISGDYLLVANERDPSPQGRLIGFIRDSIDEKYYYDTLVSTFTPFTRPNFVQLDMPFAIASFSSVGTMYAYHYDGVAWTYVAAVSSGYSDIKDSLVYTYDTGNNRIGIYGKLPSTSLYDQIDPPPGFTFSDALLKIIGDTLYVVATNTLTNTGSKSILRYNINTLQLIDYPVHSEVDVTGILSFAANQDYLLYSSTFNTNAGDVRLVKYETDETRLNGGDFKFRNGLAVWETYNGTKTASALGKIESGNILGIATDGTVIEIPDSTPKAHIITRTIYDGDAALPDSTVTVNGTFNAGFWRVPESMDGYTLTKASFGIFDKGDMSTSGATYSFGVQKCNGSNMSCSNSSNVNFTPSSETELELTLSITLNANDILRVNYQPPQGCGGGCGTENVNGLVVSYTIQEN